MRRIICLLITAIVLTGCGGADDSADPVGEGLGEVARGEATYARTCAVCHGPELEGTTRGPTFLHEVYVPSHHSDQAFLTAVRRGVPPHHWNFGPMPPVGGLSDQDVADVIAYVRAAQEDAGITD